MKKFLLAICCVIFSLNLDAQINDANIVVDYSNATICGLDEESFAEIEKDWYKDNPEITGNMIEEIIDKIGKAIAFKKNSPNTIQISVNSISENGKFNCSVELIDSMHNSILKVNNITCSKGGTWGTKLHLIKEGAHKEGRNIGKAIKSALRNKKYKPIDKYEL